MSYSKKIDGFLQRSSDPSQPGRAMDKKNSKIPQFLLCLYNHQNQNWYLLLLKCFLGKSGSQKVEVDRNRIFLPGTRNLPGIRFPVLVPGFDIFQLLGYWLGSWFWKISTFLGKPGILGLIPGTHQEALFCQKFVLYKLS